MTWATSPSVGRPPSINRGGAGACTILPGQARQAYLGRRTTRTRNWAGITSSRSACVDRTSSVLLGFGRGQRLLRVLKPERELIWIELFRTAAEAMTLQRLDDGTQPGALADCGIALLLNTSNRFRMPCSFGLQ